MKINTSHYLPLDIQNLINVLSVINVEDYEISAGIILQVIPKHSNS
jgi:hypothetical protein